MINLTNAGSESEEFFLPYEDNEIFSYLDNQEVCIHFNCNRELLPPPLSSHSHTSHTHSLTHTHTFQLPPVLVEVLGQTKVNLMIILYSNVLITGVKICYACLFLSTVTCTMVVLYVRFVTIAVSPAPMAAMTDTSYY